MTRWLPPLLLLAAAPLAIAWAARRHRGVLEGEGGRIAVLGAMTFALAAALEIGLGRVLRSLLEAVGVPGELGSLVLVGLAVALAHEPLRAGTYRHFLPAEPSGRRRAASLLYGLGYGGAMAALAALVLLSGLALEALGGDGVRALGFGEGLARRADMRAAFSGVEPWRGWLAALDQMLWAIFQVGACLFVALRPLRRALLLLPLHAALVAGVLYAAERSLQLETAAHGAAGLLGALLATLAWRSRAAVAQGDSERSSVT